MLHQSFLAIVIFYQFALALRDYMVTGVLAKGLPPDGRFHAYCLVTSLEVAAFAALAAFSEPLWIVAALKAWTVGLTWFGGGLDWIYFVAKGDIPAWDKVWHWIPFRPTTFKWLLWTLFCWVPTIFCWAILLI